MKNDSSNYTDGKGIKNNNIIKFPGVAKDSPPSEPLSLTAAEMPAQDQVVSQDESVNLADMLTLKKKDSQAKAMVLLANQSAILFHTSDGEVYATIDEDGVHKTIKVRSKTTKLWLSRLIYNATQTVPSQSSLKTAIRTLEAKALFDGPESEVHIRYAYHAGCYYIDLCNERWEQVRISPLNRQIIDAKDSPIRFRREKGMAGMCYPAENGSLEPLRGILNLENASDFNLIVGWLIGAMNPTGPFPIMTLVGEQGSAKSTTAKMLKNLTDPATIDLVALPRNERELAIAASRTWTLPYDNLSKLSNSLSDAFCRLSTGGGFRTRSLYSDDSEMLFTSVRR